MHPPRCVNRKSQIAILLALACLVLVLAAVRAAQLQINLGTTANDNTGDTLRTAFQKVNSNFTDLYLTAFTNGGAFTLNGLTATSQTFSAGSSGTDFAVSSTGTNHTFNLPTQDGTKVRGLLSSNNWHSFTNVPVQNRSGVTALTGGGTALDGIPTAGVIDTGTLVAVSLGNGTYLYQLLATASAESSPDLIRPDDYAPGSNERGWFLVQFNVPQSPMTANSATAKAYVDAKTWAASAITSGTIDTNRLPALVADLGAITASAGDLFYYDGTHLRRLAKGPEGWVVGISNSLPIYTTNLADLFITNFYSTTINATTIKVGGKNVPALHINTTNTAPDANIQDTATIAWAFNGTSNWTASVPNNGITYAKLQDVTATQRALGRNTAGSGDPEEITASQILDWIGSTRGSILYRGASGWAVLTPGTSGHVLTSNGSGADPSYQAASGGGGSGVSTQVTPLAYSGTNITGFDCTTNNMTYTLTLTNDCLFGSSTFVGLPNTTTNVFFTLALKQDATGTRVPKFTNSIVAWSEGVQPVITTNANSVSYLYFHSHLFTNGMLVGSVNVNVK